MARGHIQGSWKQGLNSQVVAIRMDEAATSDHSWPFGMEVIVEPCRAPEDEDDDLVAHDVRLARQKADGALRDLLIALARAGASPGKLRTVSGCLSQIENAT